jgi:hypothetical protein
MTDADRIPSMTGTRAIPDGSIVLAAWDADANHFFDLSFLNPADAGLAGTYARGRANRMVEIGRWKVVGFSELTGSYELVVEGTSGPRFLAPRRYLVPTGVPMSAERARRLARALYEPATPAPRVYPHSGDFVSQDRPTCPEWRDLAAFLTLPGTCKVVFYCQTPDVPDRVHQVLADLDPDTNRGYVRCQISPYGSVWVTDARGRTVPLVKCPRCGSSWCAEGDTGYGTTNDCTDCGYSSYFDRGD